MSTISTDERREVARRLREYDNEEAREQLVDCADWGERVLNMLDCGDTEGECYAALADLIEPATKCSEAAPKCDRDALLALAEVLSTPELETDCGTCPLRKWCEEARDSGNRITCFECKLWHTADVIREALGIEP